MVPQGGFEPPTDGLWWRRQDSNLHSRFLPIELLPQRPLLYQLSYWSKSLEKIYQNWKKIGNTREKKKQGTLILKISSINCNHLIIAVCAFTYSINNLPFFIAFECFIDNRYIPTGYDLLRRQVKKDSLNVIVLKLTMVISESPIIAFTLR